MARRTTKNDIKALLSVLNQHVRPLGIEYEVNVHNLAQEGGYNSYRLESTNNSKHRPNNDISPRLSIGEFGQWLRAYIQGIELIGEVTRYNDAKQGN